jgi:hypothetical protein
MITMGCQSHYSVSFEQCPTYAAIFELAGDPADALRAMNATAESGEMHMRDAIDGSSFSMSAWKPGAVELTFNPSADDTNEVPRLAAIAL